MNKIFSVLLLVTFSFGIISCSNEDPSGATSQLGQVLDQPNSTDDRNIIDLPDLTLDNCYLIDNSTIDNSTVDKSSISDNSSIKDSTVNNCSTVTRSIIDNSSTVDYSTISSSTINRSYICARSTVENSTVDNATVCDSSTVRGGSTVKNGSTVCDGSTIDNATIDNASVCNSTIIDRDIRDVTMSESVAPTVDNVSSDNSSGSYTVGSNIIIKVAFNETVFVDNSTGNPKIELETGSTDDNATYISGDNSSFLYFIYTVGTGDNTTNLNYKSNSSLYANGSTIRDNSSNDATLTLPCPTCTPYSLGTNKGIVIDTTGPTALLITCYESSNTPKNSCVDVPPGGHVVVRSSEVGTAYLVHTSVSVSNLASITGEDNNKWNDVPISSVTDNATLALTGLLDEGDVYKLYAADALGNVSDESTGPGGRSGNNRGTMTYKFD